MLVKGGVGYVWTFASTDVVVYLFSESREGGFLKETLGDFKGVLVSDFYGAYDSVACPQQKCFVHFIRDLNDDLLKAPFDAELKAIVERLTALLQAIVAEIDRYGLKRRHLVSFGALKPATYRRVRPATLPTSILFRCKFLRLAAEGLATRKNATRPPLPAKGNAPLAGWFCAPTDSI